MHTTKTIQLSNKKDHFGANQAMSTFKLGNENFNKRFLIQGNLQLLIFLPFYLKIII